MRITRARLATCSSIPANTACARSEGRKHEGAGIERNAKPPLAQYLHRPLHYLAPPRREMGSVGAFDFRREQPLRYVLADVLLPLRPRRSIRPHGIGSILGTVEFDHCAAGILWMQLHAEVAAVTDQVGGAHAKRRAVRLPLLRIVAVHDHHVAMALLVAFEKPARRRAFTDRGNDLEEIRPDRKKHVLQAVPLDVRVAIAFLEPEYFLYTPGFTCEVRGDQADLAQSQAACPGLQRHQRPLNAGARFST